MATGFRSRIVDYAAPAFHEGVGQRLLYALGLGADLVAEKMVQAVKSHMPTFANLDALLVLAADRGITPGLSESRESLAARVQTAFDAWHFAGSNRAVLSQLLGYLLSKTPRILTVSTRYAYDSARLAWDLANTLGSPITAATNASPIVLTTGKAHGFSTGATVTVTGVMGNTAANGGSHATVVDATRLRLNGTSGNGSYTGGGRIISTAAIPTASYPPTRISSTWDVYPAGRSLSAEPVHAFALAGAAGDFDWDSATQVNGSWSSWGSVLVIESVAPNDWCHQTTWTLGSTPYASIADWAAVESVGIDVTNGVILGIFQIAGQFKAANNWIRDVAISFDASLFDPAGNADGIVNPNGMQGTCAVISRDVSTNKAVYLGGRLNPVAYCGGVI